MKSASGTETETDTANPYPPPVAGPFHDSKETTSKIDAFSMTIESETPIHGFRWVNEDGTSDGRTDDGSRAFAEAASGHKGHAETQVTGTSKTSTTYKFSDIVFTTKTAYDNSHVFPAPPVKPCGCGGSASAGGLDLTGLASALLSMLGPIFGGSKVPSAVYADAATATAAAAAAAADPGDDDPDPNAQH